MQTRLPNGQIVYQEDYSCVVEPQGGKGGIYVGNLEAAQNIKTLKKHGIRAILTAAKGIDLNHPKSEIPFYLIIPGEDKDGFDMTRFFTQGVNFIRDALETTSIMVHCLAGVSRSVCLVLAYLIKCKGFSYDEAYSLVKMKRNIIHPNEGFIAQLRKFELQVRSNGIMKSPSKYQDISPSKKRYEYLYQRQQPRISNPESYKYQNKYQNATISGPYISPTKRGLTDSYAPYESPSKKSFQQMIEESYQKPTRNIQQYSPSKLRVTQARHSEEVGTYAPILNSHIQMRHISPQRRRQIQVEPRGRSSSNLDSQHEVKKNVDHKRIFGNYDRLRQTSAMELSQQLDSKIAAIRQKYAQYTKNQFSTCRRMPGKEPEPRFNNYIDENEASLPGPLGFKRISSEYEGLNSKLNERQYGIVNNNLGRTSVGAGLGLRRLNSMREGY